MNLKPVFALFETAVSHKLKYPKIRLNATDGHTVVLKLAGSKSKYTGQLMVTDDRPFGSNTYYGRIAQDGTYHASYSSTPAVLNLLNRLSSETAAKLIILDNIADGSRLLDMPKSTIFLVMRKTAAESIVIGWLLRNTLTEEWCAAVKSLDYAKLMQNGGK